MAKKPKRSKLAARNGHAYPRYTELADIVVANNRKVRDADYFALTAALQAVQVEREKSQWVRLAVAQKEALAKGRIIKSAIPPEILPPADWEAAIANAFRAGAIFQKIMILDEAEEGLKTRNRQKRGSQRGGEATARKYCEQQATRTLRVHELQREGLSHSDACARVAKEEGIDRETLRKKIPNLNPRHKK